MTGNLEALALYAGQSVSLVSRVSPAGEIVNELAKEAVAAIEDSAVRSSVPGSAASTEELLLGHRSSLRSGGLDGYSISGSMSLRSALCGRAGVIEYRRATVVSLTGPNSRISPVPATRRSRTATRGSSRRSCEAYPRRELFERGCEMQAVRSLNGYGVDVVEYVQSGRLALYPSS